MKKKAWEIVIRDALIRRDMTWLQVSFPVEISPMVTPLHNRLYSFVKSVIELGAVDWHNKLIHTSICSGVQVSRSIDLTLLIWVPMPRWMPEHRMQRNTPL